MTAITLLSDTYTDVCELTDRLEELRAIELEDGSDELAEYAELESLLDELRGNGGDHQWEGHWYTATLIADSYFEQAMDDLIDDCGELPRNLPSYLRVVVDYRALQMDYTSVEVDGQTYWYR